MSNKFEEAAELQSKYITALSSVTEEDVFALFQPIFQKFPQLRALGWYQYIPSFNDGDPCVFRMGDLDAVVSHPDNEDLAEMTDDDLHAGGVRDLEGVGDWNHVTAIEGLDDALFAAFELVTEDISKRVFGQNAQIIITKDQITVDDYSCGY